MSSENDRPSLVHHTLEGAPWRNQTQFVAVMTLAVIVGVIIGALYLIQTTTTTTTARVLEQMDSQRQRLERDNERLRAEIAQLESLPRVMTRAAEMGFRQAGSGEIQYLYVEGYHYSRPEVTPTPTLAPTEAAPVYDETLGGWLRKQWDGLKKQFEEWRNGE